MPVSAVSEPLLYILIIVCSRSGAFCWKLPRWCKKHSLCRRKEPSSHQSYTISASSCPTCGAMVVDEDKIRASEGVVRRQHCVTGAPRAMHAWGQGQLVSPVLPLPVSLKLQSRRGWMKKRASVAGLVFKEDLFCFLLQWELR